MQTSLLALNLGIMYKSSGRSDKVAECRNDSADIMPMKTAQIAKNSCKKLLKKTDKCCIIKNGILSSDRCKERFVSYDRFSGG